jgi:hypothetical protein
VVTTCAMPRDRPLPRAADGEATSRLGKHIGTENCGDGYDSNQSDGTQR